MATDDRQFWLQTLTRIAGPVLDVLRAQQLKARFPVRLTKRQQNRPWRREDNRRDFAPLEAFGRTLSGIAPWIELGPTQGEEGELRARYADWARAGMSAATDPKSKDFMQFATGRQPLVDAAYLAQAILRAPQRLWKELDAATQTNVITALQSTRANKPYFNNWLLFAAIVEATLYRVGAEWDPVSVEYALRQHELWYKGDGIYGDGPDFHWDYYNSYVIHPMMIDVLEVVNGIERKWGVTLSTVLQRASRYAAILERLISPEGTFPVIGRSMVYRFGAFHLLSQMALRKQLPKDVSPAQVRCALTAVMRRIMEAPGNFDSNGWLTIGFFGQQPSLAEWYISAGSPYICATVLLPLGLAPDDEFWAAPPQPWTAKKVWSGVDVPPDHALSRSNKD